MSPNSKDDKPSFHERWKLIPLKVVRRRDDGPRSASPKSSGPTEDPSSNLDDFTPASATPSSTPSLSPLRVRPHTIHGPRNSVFRPDKLVPIIESSPNSENVTLPSTPRSTSVSLKLNDGHSPMSGCGGQSLPSTPSETQAEALPTPPATVHTAYTDHTRQSSVHSLLGTGGEDKANGFANGHTGHSDDAVGRPDSSWQPAAPQYTPSGAIFNAPQLHKSPSQVTLLLDHDLRTAETTRIRDGVRRLAEVMASFDDTGHGSRPAQAEHAHSHSMPDAMPSCLPNSVPNRAPNDQPQHHLQPHNSQLQPYHSHNSQLQRSVPPPTVIPGFHPMQAGFMPFMAFWPPLQPQYIPCQCASQVQQMRGQLAELAAALEGLDFRPVTPPHSPPKYRVRRPLPPRPVGTPPPGSRTPTPNQIPSRSGTSEETGAFSGETSSGASESSASK